MNEQRYRLNSPNVIAETLDGEALIINLRSGCYYSIDGAGEAIWALLCAGWTLAEAASHLEAHFGPAAANDVHRLAAELVAEELLVSAPQAAPGAPAAVPGGAYVPPALKKYVDMQDLLAADPIHEVEATGWPNITPARAGEPVA